MSYLTEKQSIEQYFTANVTGIAIQLANVSLDVSSLSEWIRVSILNSQSAIMCLGAGTRTYRHPGLVSVQIFTKTNIGEARSLTLADQIVTLFRTSVDNITFTSPSVAKIGAQGGWYQVNVDCPFYRDNVA